MSVSGWGQMPFAVRGVYRCFMQPGGRTRRCLHRDLVAADSGRWTVLSASAVGAVCRSLCAADIVASCRPVAGRVGARTAIRRRRVLVIGPSCQRRRLGASAVRCARRVSTLHAARWPDASLPAPRLGRGGFSSLGRPNGVSGSWHPLRTETTRGECGHLFRARLGRLRRKGQPPAAAMAARPSVPSYRFRRVRPSSFHSRHRATPGSVGRGAHGRGLRIRCR